MEHGQSDDVAPVQAKEDAVVAKKALLALLETAAQMLEKAEAAADEAAAAAGQAAADLDAQVQVSSPASNIVLGPKVTNPC